ncbi:MAG: imidazole glycerol phosphate synthase subunit HisF [Gemmatimonadota bacterium]
MLTRRLIVCLDVKAGRVVKGVNFESLRDIGDPVALAERYEQEGADEIVYLDISASAEERATLLDLARRTAERLFIPLTIGGGIRSADDVARALRAGADKVSLNTSAVERPEVLAEASHRFGAQCVVASIDAAQVDGTYRVFVKGGKVPTDLEAVAWARECERQGAGEILLTSIDRDGVRGGYDLRLTRAISEAVRVPVIASGGAGSAAHVVEAFRDGGAAAALVAGIVHDRVTTVAMLKAAMAAAGIPVRNGEWTVDAAGASGETAA